MAAASNTAVYNSAYAAWPEETSAKSHHKEVDSLDNHNDAAG
jgi:hypothetical protein